MADIAQAAGTIGGAQSSSGATASPVAIDELPDDNFQQPATDADLSDAGDTSSADAADNHASEYADLESFFAEGKGETDEREGTDDEDDDLASDEGHGGGRAQKRIRKLSQDLRAATSQQSALQQQLQAQSAWSQQAYAAFQQQQQLLHQQQVEMARLQAMVEHRMPAEPEDDVTKFRRQLKEELLGEATQSISPQVQAALDRANMLEKQWKDAQLAQQREQRRHQYNQQVDVALDQVIKPIVDADTYAANKSLLGGLVISLAYGQGCDMETAANTLKSVINRTALGVIRHRRSTQGAKVEATQAVPEKVRGRPAAAGESLPSMALLRKHGFRDYLKWQLAGSPTLSG